MKRLGILGLAVFLMVSGAYAGNPDPRRPSREDKCPVCGMFVSKYSDFLAQIIFRDGTTVFFDGTKDMFKYYLGLGKYAPSRDPSEVAAVYVTDYYSLMAVDGTTAFYVIGSKIHGPMGHELIPFMKEEDANEFMFDHLGKEIIPFKGITLEIVKGLD